MSTSRRIIVVGGGAAGVFAAIACAEAAPDAEVIVLEKSAQFLAKVRISGGGRCNVTHACFDPREFARHYPRGEQALIGAFHQFQARHTVEWFESHGVKLKAERDGRMFPATDSSQTIVDCLLSEAKKTGVMLHANCGVDSIVRQTNGGFMVTAGQVASEKSSSGVLNAPQGLGVRQPSAALSAPEHQKRQRAAAVQNAGAPSEGLLAGWRLLFARLPLAWASLAALWIALIGVNLMLPSPMVRMAEPGAPSAEMELLASWDFQPAGVEPSDDLGTPASRALPATKQQEVPIRPRSERRRGVDVGETQPDSSFDFIA